MSEESRVRSVLVEMLKPVLAFPVENTAHVGCPDVCCLLGWIEIKLAERPARPDTRVSVVVRPAQRLWMRKWGTQQGNCWWLTRLRGGQAGGCDLSDTWTLHDGVDGADHLGKDWTERHMLQRAVWSAQSLDRVPGDLVLDVLLAITRRTS